MLKKNVVLGLLALVIGALSACGPAVEPSAVGGPLAMRRLTGDQYRRAIADVFGADIKVAGRFEPAQRGRRAGGRWVRASERRRVRVGAART